jgi:bacilysin biosynthesis protein BacB
MSVFFPEPEKKSIAPGIESRLFKMNDKSETQIILSNIAPGAILQPHSHTDVQVGMALFGRFVMQVGEQEKILDPLQTAYVAHSNVPHAARNIFNEWAISLDIKHSNPKNSSAVKYNGDVFLNLVNDIRLKTGIRMQFFVTPWCEIMLSYIPPGAVMPTHAHDNEQFGIAVKGKYIMRVGEEEETFEYGKIYFSPSNVPHGADNPYSEEAVSLNIFIPPRYNLIPKKIRPAEDKI